MAEGCTTEDCDGVLEITEMQRIPIITCPSAEAGEFLCTPEFLRTLQPDELWCPLLKKVHDEAVSD